ncbi:MAG: ParB/RepB/Spo0J family partition protein [Proteobacteria bacterium]|nr:ParB/RepB/Spo0J family partition protein [Pseudomonadota bacterium]
MSRVAALDLSGLAQFRPSALLDAMATAGSPQEVALDLIAFDPAQPRRSLDEASLAELAASIQVYGVLEPVSLRSDPARAGRFVVNRGERRVRASHLAGKATVPAWIDERVDRYAQVVENLQREDLTPFDLARFIAERESEGEARSDIAARLNKPASFITEVAALVEAPETIRALYDSGRVRDTRVLYRILRAQRQRPAAIAALLDGDAPITREVLSKVCGAGKRMRIDEAKGRQVEGTKAADALLVEHAGRRGRLGWHGWPGRRTGEVRFDDGTQDVLELTELKVIAWTMR